MCHMRGHDFALHDLSRNTHAGNMHPAIFVRGKIVGANFWCGHRVGACDMNGAEAFWTQLAGAKSHAGKFVKHTLFRIGKAGIGDVVLDIGASKPVTAAHKTGQHACRHAQHPAPRQHILQYGTGKTNAACLMIDG